MKWISPIARRLLDWGAPCALAVVALVAVPLAVAAQGRPNANKPAPQSFSNHKPSHASGKGTFQPVSQQNVADAILADTLSTYFEQADEHFHEGEYNHIVSLCSILVQGDPHNMEAYANSGYLLWSTDRVDQALAFLKQGLKANPNHYYMYDEVGTCYLIYLRDPKAALPYFEQSVRILNKMTSGDRKAQGRIAPSTYHNLAHCYEKTNQWDKAVEAWSQAATVGGDNGAAQVRLKRAQAELAKRRR